MSASIKPEQSVATGNVAAGAADSGNPVKTGGVYNSTQPTLVTGQRGDLQLTSRSALWVGVQSGAGTAAGVLTAADTVVNSSTTGLVVAAIPSVFNGTTWDRLRGDITNGVDVDVTRTVLPVPASTATVTSVNDAATSATLLSSSATRKGFRIYNHSTQVLYVKYGTTASATDFTVLVAAGGYLEENHYYGRVDGIWAADAAGAARITELT